MQSLLPYASMHNRMRMNNNIILNPGHTISGPPTCVSCHSGVTVMWQWCYSGVTMVLQWCYNSVPVDLYCYAHRTQVTQFPAHLHASPVGAGGTIASACDPGHHRYCYGPDGNGSVSVRYCAYPPPNLSHPPHPLTPLPLLPQLSPLQFTSTAAFCISPFQWLW
jgi:hypothetical protein